MKKTILKVTGLIVLALGIFTSCTTDEEDSSSSSFVLDPNNFQGTISDGEVILNAGTVYKLTGKIQVNEGATLIIPAGTIIEGVGGTASYIAVTQGGKINVNGTSSNPVIFTSGLATKAPGDWGGLVICGKAPINRVDGGTGTAQSEVADLTYGGTIANDNSGSIRYLRIEYAGAAFNSEKEFNGVSLFGVGSGTTFEYVEALNGSDDGFEFFGGTVNTSNLVSIGNEDDQYDWTEGWNGTNSNWYGKVANGKGNRGIEADNFELGFLNMPIANPTITNMTLVGPGSSAEVTVYPENQAIKLRRGTKGIFSNVYLEAWKTGFDIEHDETISYVGSSLMATNVNFNDVPTQTKGKKTDGTSEDVSTAVTVGTGMGAGNGSGAPGWSSGWAIGF
ncbi:hypothetical protein [Flavobacterium sp.]|uniref:hypothetical protein n=1 Tax=Flavobacterium sp. TaxID=239 RepID=UPI00261C64A4|nr:hypothetical protein [Flavobacterium sp.]MDD2985417.1 hypothetical protein [Flavobacterium sp.]